MIGFLVHLIVRKDLVGLFFARTATELMVSIDECTEPAECDHIYLPPGSIYRWGPAIGIPVRIWTPIRARAKRFRGMARRSLKVGGVPSMFVIAGCRSIRNELPH